MEVITVDGNGNGSGDNFLLSFCTFLITITRKGILNN